MTYIFKLMKIGIVLLPLYFYIFIYYLYIYFYRNFWIIVFWKSVQCWHIKLIYYNIYWVTKFCLLKLEKAISLANVWLPKFYSPTQKKKWLHTIYHKTFKQVELSVNVSSWFTNLFLKLFIVFIVYLHHLRQYLENFSL